MKIRWIIWTDVILDKLRQKHNVEMEEVEDLLLRRPHFRLAQRGRVRGEDVYVASGQTDPGRHIVVFFIHKKPDGALPISARDMTDTERRCYEKKPTRG